MENQKLEQAKRTIVIFGAPDQEEQVARKQAKANGFTIGTATFQGKPVHGGNAYKADGHTVDYGDKEMLMFAVIFECSREAATTLSVATTCDHHNPGDFGYELPPEHFWIASSIGQLFEFIGITAHETSNVSYVAAGDHCPADAYAGRCPGIEPGKFAKFRINQIAEFELSKLPLAQRNNTNVPNMAYEVDNEISDAWRALNNATEVNGIKDLREFGEIPQLPEAALKTGQAYMAKIPERGRDFQPTGNSKIVLGGHTTPKQVEEFMAWAKTLDNRIGEPYGNPTRGFAGVVVGPISKSCPTCGEIWACANAGSCPACGIQYPEEG